MGGGSRLDPADLAIYVAFMRDNDVLELELPGVYLRLRDVPLHYDASPVLESDLPVAEETEAEVMARQQREHIEREQRLFHSAG